MSGYYTSNPHYAPDTINTERRLRFEEEAAKLFSFLTVPQTAAYHVRIAAASIYRGAPRWDRERRLAAIAFASSTADARRIYELALSDLMRDGEISEETSYAADEALLAQTMVDAPAMQAAE